ncbi:MAG: nickel-dependent hydrogenase large subunit [Gammaproteobacteria bacterium]|nr:nickel-dependent hydrogenase large subunit [Gammaproteobacteria bacterium]
MNPAARSPLEGCLDIELACRGERVERVVIQSARPLLASRLLENVAPDEALRRIPRVFSICATAQCEAALRACEQALGLTPSPAQRRARDMLVWMETAREHLLRILLDWPGFLDEPGPGERLPQVMRLLPDLRRALFGEAQPFRLDGRPAIDLAALTGAIDALRSLTAQVLGSGGDLSSPLRSRTAFDAWLARGDALPARLLHRVRELGWQGLGGTHEAWLPALDAEVLRARLAMPGADAFVAAPDWQGTHCETTALERQRRQPLVADLLANEGNGLLTRLVARLVELEDIPKRLERDRLALEWDEACGDSAAPVAGGNGLAQVEAARGRLIHYVEIARGAVRRFRILAPTEWNFHPAGVAAQGLLTLCGDDEAVLRRQAALWINAVDPCVGFHLRRTVHA